MRLNRCAYSDAVAACHVPPAADIALNIHAQGSPEAFASYLRQYGNTICGRHPIGVFLNVSPKLLSLWDIIHSGHMNALTGAAVQMLRACRMQHSIRFKHYDQSSRCVTTRDSSVSYAAAVVTVASPSSAAPVR